MATEFICIWVADAGSAILLDRRTCLRAQLDPNRTAVQRARLVVANFAERSVVLGKLPAQAAEAAREVLWWPMLCPSDTALIVGPSALTALSVHDFEVAPSYGQSGSPARIAVESRFTLDRALALDADPDAWWVVSQLAAPSQVGYDFHAATLIEPNHLMKNLILEPGERSPPSLLKRLVRATEAEQQLGSSAATFWIVPFKGDRVGPAVVVESVISNPAVRVAVAFEATQQGGLQPTLHLTCREGLSPVDLVKHLQVLHWRRNAAALAYPDLVIKNIEWPAGTRSEAVVHFDQPVRHGDVFGLICPDQLVRIAGSANDEAPDAAASESIELSRVLFVRRERSAEPVASDRTLSRMDVLGKLAELTLRKRRADFARLREAWGERLERIAFASTYLMPASIRQRARASLHLAIRTPDVRLDRIFHAVTMSHRLEKLARDDAISRPPPFLITAATPLDSALAEVLWDSVFAEGRPADWSLLHIADPGRAALLRCLIHPLTHFAAATALSNR